MKRGNMVKELRLVLLIALACLELGFAGPSRELVYSATARATSTLRPTRTPFPTYVPTPPPLKSTKYLNDTSLLTGKPCSPPCFRNIVPGQTTFEEALSLIRKDPSFKDLITQAMPPAATWSAANGEPCCQLSANPESGLVNAILIKVTPIMTTQQIIDKYGVSTYVNPVDYSEREVTLALIFPDIGLVTWVSPGDGTSVLTGKSPVIMVLYIDPKDWNKVLSQATLQGWNGYLLYKTYRNATPIVTPQPTATPQ
jgi:hypothetical protein